MHWKVRSRSAAPSCSPDQTPAMRRASSAASSSSRVRVRVRPTASRGSLDRETKRPAGAAVVRGASVTRSQPTRCHIGASPTAPMSHRVGTGRHGPGRAGPGRAGEQVSAVCCGTGSRGLDGDRDSCGGPSSGVMGGTSFGRAGWCGSLSGHAVNLSFASTSSVHTSLSFPNPGVSYRP